MFYLHPVPAPRGYTQVACNGSNEDKMTYVTICVFEKEGDKFEKGRKRESNTGRWKSTRSDIRRLLFDQPPPFPFDKQPDLQLLPGWIIHGSLPFHTITSYSAFPLVIIHSLFLLLTVFLICAWRLGSTS